MRGLKQALKDARKRSGITQREAADEASIALGTLRRWEQGVNEPDAESLVRLADLYDVTVGQLLGVTEGPATGLSGDGMGGPSTRRLLGIAWDASGAGHPFQNLRAAWQTWMRWEMRVEPWAIEAAMGHLAPGVTGRHYDRPQADAVAEVISEAYGDRPYDAGWSWAVWDDLGRGSCVSAGQ